MARLIAGVIRDPGRAEELAVEVFLRWQKGGVADHSKASAWLHRTAVRAALDELRGRRRRERLERIVPLLRRPRTPEEIHLAGDRKARVAAVLAKMKPRDAELLVLRADGMSYGELAGALSLTASSIGTLLARAQQSFRREYVRRYGNTE